VVNKTCSKSYINSQRRNSSNTGVVVPEISSLDAINVIQTTVSLSWSIGETQHVDVIQLFQSGSVAMNWSSLTSSYTVTSLDPGTEYEFFVKILSYGYTDETQPIIVTTGSYRK